MMNKSIGNGNVPSESGAATNELSGGMDWNRRAGPIFKYGLAVGFTPVGFKSAMNLSVNESQLFLSVHGQVNNLFNPAFVFIDKKLS